MKGLLFMGVLGFAIGTLVAPKKGSELRKDIKDMVAGLQENGADVLLDAQTKATEMLDKAQPALDQIKETAMHMKESGMQIKESAKEGAMHVKESAMQLKETAKEGAMQVKEGALHLKETAKDGVNQVKEGAMQLKETAMALKDNATKSFQEGYEKQQAAAQQRKMEQAKYFDPSNSPGSTASSF